MGNKFYVTTTLPYVNAKPHIGFALEIIEADVLSRFHREVGDEVFFNTGTDEHGLKIFKKAEELGISAQKYCNDESKFFEQLKESLNLSYDSFVRTTDLNHIKAAQEFWRRCEASGDIYKKNYKTKYCVGCELEKTDSELVDGRCPIHPNMELEIIDEENYFFRLSKYQEQLLELYKKNPEFVIPAKRLNEVRSFVERGLQDFSISRLKSKMPWGVEVPSDSDHVMYVWFDALVNYISAIGWPDDVEKFEKWWPVVQLAGKDNLRQQACMWQAMLMSAGMPNSKQIFINGFIGVGGQKMSKSLGNVINPSDMVEKFGTDGTRYLLLSYGNFGEDMDVSWEKFIEKYNADLANGLGNLLSRVIKLSEKAEFKITNTDLNDAVVSSADKMEEFFNNLELGKALDFCRAIVRQANIYVDENKPWELAHQEDKTKFNAVIKKLTLDLNVIAEILAPFMPETSEKIKKALETKQTEPLFQRLK